MSNPKILNLDDLETPETDIVIKHKGKDHPMRVLDVDGFIRQQKRAAEHQARAEKLDEVSDQDVAEIVVIIRDAVKEFFPTLPVDTLPPSKLFAIFAWLNELTAKVNASGAPVEGEGVTTEGNVTEGEKTPS